MTAWPMLRLAQHARTPRTLPLPLPARQVPGWVVGAPTSATGRYIPGPQPAGMWNPMIR
jgi:hypothetical protein